jgi:hypothetical protein
MFGLLSTRLGMTILSLLQGSGRTTGHTYTTRNLTLSALNSGTNGVGDESPTTRSQRLEAYRKMLKNEDL